MSLVLKEVFFFFNVLLFVCPPNPLEAGLHFVLPALTMAVSPLNDSTLNGLVKTLEMAVKPYKTAPANKLRALVLLAAPPPLPFPPPSQTTTPLPFSLTSQAGWMLRPAAWVPLAVSATQAERRGAASNSPRGIGRDGGGGRGGGGWLSMASGGGKGAICRDKGQHLGSPEDTHGCNPLQLAAQTASLGHAREALTPRPRSIHMKGPTLTLFMGMTFCAGGGGGGGGGRGQHNMMTTPRCDGGTLN